MMSKLARAISDLAKASINVKKHVADARAKALVEAAATVEKTASQAGVSPETIQRIRRDVLRMAA
jgi:AraC-like DNA-binding protein